MTQSTLFATEEAPEPKRCILRAVKTTFEKISTVADHPIYYHKDDRYTAPDQVYRMFQEMKDHTKESFVALHLDGKNRVICYEVVSTGTLNQSMVHPREVFSVAVSLRAAAIILVHNHPSGDPAPSSEDREITRRLKEAGEILGIRVLDHIIVGDSDFFSFTSNGML